MRRISICLGRYLLWALPAVISIVLWGMFQGQEGVIRSGNTFLVMLREILSWNIILWFVALAITFILLVASPAARDELLTRMTGIRERDERERYITGRAARFTFFATLAMVMFLLFLSTVHVRITRLDPGMAVAGKTAQLSLGFSFGDFELKPEEGDAAGRDMVNVHGLHLPNEVILLFLMLWHTGCFLYMSRRGDSAE